MPIFDLKRAYTDHIKSLNAEERKAFGRNLMQAMQDMRAARVAQLPPMPEGEPPIPPAGLFGERFVSLGELAVRFADGRYSSVEGEALDRMLDNELDSVFYGIMEDEAGLDNSLLNELLERAKDPAAYLTENRKVTPKRYAVDQDEKDRRYYASKYKAMNELFGGLEPLDPDGIARRRESDRAERDRYADKIAEALIAGFGEESTYEGLQTIRQRFEQGSRMATYNVGLKLKTGIDLRDEFSREIRAAVRNSYNQATKALNRDRFHEELRKAAKKIADADLYRYMEDKIAGLGQYAATGDTGSLHEDSFPAYTKAILEEIDKNVADEAPILNGIPAAPEVPLTKEQIADKLFQGYLNAGDLRERILYLAQAQCLAEGPLTRVTYDEALNLFMRKAIKYEFETDGQPDREKAVNYVNTMAELRAELISEEAGAQNITDTYSRATTLGTAIVNAERFIVDDKDDLIAPYLEHFGLPDYVTMMNAHQSTYAHSDEFYDFKRNFARKRLSMPMEDPVERSRYADISTAHYHNLHSFQYNMIAAEDVLKDLGGAAIFTPADAVHLSRFLNNLEHAEASGREQLTPEAVTFKQNLTELINILQKTENPLELTQEEMNRVVDLKRGVTNSVLDMFRGKNGNPPLKPGSMVRDCAAAVYEYLDPYYSSAGGFTAVDRTAAKWIEDIQGAVRPNGGNAPASLQVAQVLAARLIADSVPGHRDRLDATGISSLELAEMTNRIVNDPTFTGFIQAHGNDPALRSALLTGHGGGIEDQFRGYMRTLPAGEMPNDPLLQRYMPNASDRIRALAEQASSSAPGSDQAAKAAAEILLLRKKAHARGDDPKSMSKPIPADGKLQDEIQELTENEDFRDLLKERFAAYTGYGETLENQIIARDEDDEIPFLDTLTVSGRMAEICVKDAAAVKEKLQAAILKGDQKAVDAARKEYLGMIAELIALDETAREGDPDRKIPWDKVDEKISKIGTNPAYQAISADLRPEIIYTDCTRLIRDGRERDEGRVPGALNLLEKSHRPWKTAARRMKEEQQRIYAAEDVYKTAAAQQTRENRIGELVENAVQQVRQTGREPSAKERQAFRKDAERRTEVAMYRDLSVIQKPSVYRMLAEHQLSGGDPNARMSDIEVERFAQKLNGNETLGVFLNQFRDDPKALRDTALKGDGADLKKAFHDYLTDLPAGELRNDPELSAFMPTYLERIEALQKQSAAAAEASAAARETADKAQRKADDALSRYCRANRIPFGTDEEKLAAKDTIRLAAEAAGLAQAGNAQAPESEAQKAWRLIRGADEANAAARNAEAAMKTKTVAAAAEIVTLRNMAHAGRDEKSRLEVPIRADGAIDLKRNTGRLADTDHFKRLVDNEAIRLTGKGHGGRMFEYLKDRSVEAVESLAGDGPEKTARRNVSRVFKVNTLGGRLNEIRQTEADDVSRKLNEAMASGKQEAVDKAVEDYRKLVAEVIVLNNAFQRDGADRQVDWKSVNKSIDRRDTNQAFQQMTRNLTPATVLSALNSLKNDSLNEFLTRQAARLNQVQQNGAQPQQQQPAADGPEAANNAPGRN